MAKNLKNKKIAIILAFQGFRDEEYFIPKKILERAGFQIKTVSSQKGLAIGDDGGEAEVDLLISEVNPADFDGIIFVGGPGCLKYLDNEKSYSLAKETVIQNKVLAAICIAPIILAKAGVLDKKQATVWSSALDREPVRTLKENHSIYQEKDVVLDGKIITANGPVAAEEFAQEIVQALTNNS